VLEGVEGVLDEYRAHLPMTGRQVFYALVGRGAIAKTEQSYERLSNYLNRARRAGLIPFEDIRDDGITSLSSETFADVEDFHAETARRARDYRRDRQAGQLARLELWCEAAGMAPQLARVADRYSVPVYSAGGFASVTGTYNIAQRAAAVPDGPLVVLHVGDLDPSGESIFTALIEDAAAFALGDEDGWGVVGERVALTAAQVAEYRLPTAPPKGTDSRSARWGGTGTCQLEALPPDVLAGTVETAIRRRLDLDHFAAVMAEEKAERDSLLGLDPRGPQP